VRPRGYLRSARRGRRSPSAGPAPRQAGPVRASAPRISRRSAVRRPTDTGRLDSIRWGRARPTTPCAGAGSAQSAAPQPPSLRPPRARVATTRGSDSRLFVRAHALAGKSPTREQPRPSAVADGDTCGKAWGRPHGSDAGGAGAPHLASSFASSPPAGGGCGAGRTRRGRLATSPVPRAPRDRATARARVRCDRSRHPPRGGIVPPREGGGGPTWSRPNSCANRPARPAWRAACPHPSCRIWGLCVTSPGAPVRVRAPAQVGCPSVPQPGGAVPVVTSGGGLVPLPRRRSPPARGSTGLPSPPQARFALPTCTRPATCCSATSSF